MSICFEIVIVILCCFDRCINIDSKRAFCQRVCTKHNPNAERHYLLHHRSQLRSQCQTSLGTHLGVNDADGCLVPHVLLKALGRGRVEAQHSVVAVCVSQKIDLFIYLFSDFF